MTVDLLSLICGFLFGFAGLGVSLFAIVDNRKQRTEREKAVIAARSTVERVYGTLIGLKAGTTIPSLLEAINDGLSAINDERSRLTLL